MLLLLEDPPLGGCLVLQRVAISQQGMTEQAMLILVCKGGSLSRGCFCLGTYLTEVAEYFSLR